jgi:contact-dependent growth inhibition (CDI) system CdiA-like toxin
VDSCLLRRFRLKFNLFNGAWPSGKAPGFGPGIRGFESLRPSQKFDKILISMARQKAGSIVIPAGLDVWKHELKTAQVFARHGCTVEFLVTNQVQRVKTADVLIDGVTYEIKSPRADKLSAVERNLKRATKQSGNIIVDSRRMRKIHDTTIQSFLLQKLKQQRTIKKLLFVNRKHEIIDISELL